MVVLIYISLVINYMLFFIKEVIKPNFLSKTLYSYVLTNTKNKLV